MGRWVGCQESEREKGVYWYIIGSVTCSSNPDRRGSRSKSDKRAADARGERQIDSDGLARPPCQIQDGSAIFKLTLSVAANVELNRDQQRPIRDPTPAPSTANKQNVWNLLPPQAHRLTPTQTQAPRPFHLLATLSFSPHRRQRRIPNPNGIKNS